jgi:hypothetical protein
MWIYIDGWRLVSQRILDNHFKDEHEIIKKECQDFADLIISKIKQEVLREEYCDYEADGAEIAQSLYNLVLSNREIKSNLANEISYELGYKTDVCKITQIIRVIR